MTSIVKSKPKTSTFSIRFTEEERARLERRAMGRGIGPYIRETVLREKAETRQTRGKAPIKDYEAIGRILGLLAKTGLGPSLIEMSEATQNGCLPLDDETRAVLLEAAHDVKLIKTLLMVALGVKET